MTSAARKVPYPTARPAHRPLDLLGGAVHWVGSLEPWAGEAGA
jgi:hypothetical protein